MNSLLDAFYITAIIPRIVDLIFLDTCFPVEIRMYIVSLYFKLVMPYYTFYLTFAGTNGNGIISSLRFPIFTRVGQVMDTLDNLGYYNHLNNIIEIADRDGRKTTEIFCDRTRTLCSYYEFDISRINQLYIGNTKTIVY